MGMMHNVTARLNSSFFYGVTVIGILAALNLASSFFIEQPFKAQIVSIENTKLYNNTRFGWDEANIEFSLKADLTGIYNWNIKLIYLYIQIDYVTPERNQVIIWDKIIWRDQYNKITVDLNKTKAKYMIKTHEHDLLGREAVATLKWEVVPITGFVYKMQSSPKLFKFLRNYSK
jgi:signal peptidase complex subunit 3